MKCGDCCKDLIVEESSFLSSGSHLVGLWLFPEEIKLFPKKLILPAEGIGLDKDGRGPKHILQYQVDVEKCPFLSSSKECKIYEKRPLMCRSFPLFSLDRFGTTAAARGHCRRIKELKEELGEFSKPFLTERNFQAPKEWEALQKRMNLIERQTGEYIMDSRLLWIFDLRDKRWKISAAAGLRAP